ncbi:sigma-70 family RNA polymerase sigma factor [Pseudomonas sp. NPDC008258]|uniref:sigma-70 family RNA polymerase sigma factor n=1 Tax=Pseudomonas sp. NPDC008258 TaxID=3364418 RepID=UPI0036E5C3F3
MSRLDPAYSQQVHTYYTAHHGWIRGWLHKRLGNASDAADLAHDVFVRLLSKPQQFQTEQHARAYLSTVTRHLCIDFWGRQHLQQAWLEALAALPEPMAPSEEERALVFEALEQVQGMLARLPEKVCQAFLLAQVQGLGYREIAQHLKVSERSVTKYMAQAMYQCLLLELDLP